MPRAARRKRKPEPIYLVRCKPNSERAIVRRLKDEGIRAYAPSFLEYPSSGPREVVLFPTYLFVWAKDHWREVSRTRGVWEFVRFGDEMAMVPQRVVDELRALEGPTGYIRMHPPFEVGQRVILGDGGPVVAVSALLGRDRVRVLLSMLGRVVEMTVSGGELAPA